MLNLTEAAFLEKEIALLSTSLLFDLPEKPDIKALQKVINKHIGPEIKLEELYFGNFINVPQGTEPYFVIGFRAGLPFETVQQKLDQAIRKAFFNRVRFDYINLDPNAEEEIINLNADKELAPLLVKQGIKLI